MGRNVRVASFVFKQKEKDFPDLFIPVYEVLERCVFFCSKRLKGVQIFLRMIVKGTTSGFGFRDAVFP